MSSIHYINLNQDGGAGGDMFDNSEKLKAFKAFKAKAKTRQRRQVTVEQTPEQKEQFKKYKTAVTKIQAVNRGRKERSCINELDFFINHKEECRKLSSNFATRNHLVLGKPQKMINKDGRKWIVYNAKVVPANVISGEQGYNMKPVKDKTLLRPEQRKQGFKIKRDLKKREQEQEQEQERKLAKFADVEEGQIGGLSGIIPIRLIKEKGTNGIYFVDPEKYKIDRNDEDIQTVAAEAAAAEAAAAAAARKVRYEAGQAGTGSEKFCNMCGKDLIFYDSEPECKNCTTNKIAITKMERKWADRQRERMQMEQEYKSI